ncbi:MAG TPA: DUF5915 domain-containing protein, partial [Gemmatimonadales bacterium]|nr:DUF5915 domain-containing protein [Gemmatimonadales bacterium]
DQTRGWFYSLLAIGVTVLDQTPYRNVVVNELILDAEGQKMSKSRGNVVDPHALIEEFGADTIRLYLLASSEVWKPKRFDRRTIPEVAGGFLNTLRNTYNFFSLYGEARDPSQPEPALLQPLDRWIRAELQATVNQVVEAWENYQITAGVKAVMRFVIDDLSNWYVRLSRGRFWAPDREADPAAVETLRLALITVSRLLAPAAPFASDWIHRALAGGSVHLAAFPEKAPPEEAPLREAMHAVRTLASLARAARDEGGLRVRQPLARLRVAVPASVRGGAFDDLLELLAQEVNVKAIELVGSDTELVRLSGRPNFRSLGKRYGKQTPHAAAAVGKLPTAELRRLEAGEPVTLIDGEASWVYHPEDVTVERSVTSEWLVTSAGPFVAALDPSLTDELRQEGLARELINRVQRLRKDAGYEYTTRIRLAIDGADGVRAAAAAWREFIMGETLARELDVGRPSFTPDRLEEFIIDDHAAVIAVVRRDPGANH